MTTRLRKVVWSAKAVQDLKDQAGYILERNEAAALRIARRIRETGNELGHAPIGRPGHKVGTYERVLPGLPYILVYALDPSREAVVILHVYHGAQNWRAPSAEEDRDPAN
jgi:plasmid stabilization system protein ParE